MQLANAGDTGDVGLIPSLGRSSGVGNGNPLQYSCLENSMEREDWWATAHGIQRAEQTEQLSIQRANILFLESVELFGIS